MKQQKVKNLKQAIQSERAVALEKVERFEESVKRGVGWSLDYLEAAWRAEITVRLCNNLLQALPEGICGAVKDIRDQAEYKRTAATMQISHQSGLERLKLTWRADYWTMIVTKENQMGQLLSYLELLFDCGEERNG